LSSTTSTDVMMPQLSGDELVRRVREHPELDATAILVLTARSDDDLRARLLAGGAQEYLAKPFSIAELLIRARSLIALKRGSELVRRLIECAPDGMVIVDQHGKILMINAQTETLFGYQRSELLGRPVELLVPERFRGRHPGHRGAYFDSPKVRPMGSSLDLCGVRKDGSEFPVEISLSPMKMNGGLIVTAAIRDVSERKRAEARTREAEQLRDRLIAMLEATPDFVGFANAKTAEVLYVNQAGRKMCGASDDDVKAMRIWDFHPEWANRKLTDELLPIAIEKGFWSGELSFLHRDGHEIPMLMMLMAHRGADREIEIISTISRDIRERKQAEEAERRLAGEQAARALAEEAVRVRDDFVAIAGHELKTPLSALLMQVQLLQRTASPVGEPIAKIARSGKRLERLISQLLDVSRISAGRLRLEPEPCRLAELVRGVVDHFADASAQAHCPVAIDVDERIEGEWDRLRIEAVITNLLSNAIKYGKGKPIEVDLRAVDGDAVLRVVDHGIGIDREHQTRIFQRFERAVATREYGGLGLGLWITRQIVEASGGSIEVESTPEAGSIFTVRLPLHPAEHSHA
jgi:PAS domain S-box-containing protein